MASPRARWMLVAALGAAAAGALVAYVRPLVRRLAGTPQVEGRVVGPDGAPVGGIVVRALEAARSGDVLGLLQGEATADAPTDAKGGFRFRVLRAGPWRISAYSPESHTVPRDAWLQGAAWVVAGASATGEPVEIRLRPFATSVELDLVDDDGRPIPGVTVRGSGDQMGVTDANGTARFASAWPEPAAVRLSGGPIRDGEVRAALPLEPSSGTRYRLVLAEPVTLTVHATAPDGTTLERPSLDIRLDVGPDAIACGPWSRRRDTIVVPRKRPFRLDVNRGMYEGVHTAEDARDGVLHVRCDGRADVKGRFTLPAGRVADGLLVAVMLRSSPLDSMHETWPGKLDASGAFVVHGVPAGRGSLAVSVEGSGRAGPNSCLALRELVVPRSGTLDVGDLGAPRLLHGVVRHRGRGVRSTVVLPPPFTWVHCESDEAGRYELLVPAGANCLVAAGAPGCGFVAAPVPAEPDTPLDFDLDDEAFVIVRNACDALRRPFQLEVRSGGEYVTWIQADEMSGDAVIGRLAPGRVDLSWRDARGPRSLSIDMRAGEVSVVDLAMHQ